MLSSNEVTHIEMMEGSSLKRLYFPRSGRTSIHLLGEEACRTLLHVMRNRFLRSDLGISDTGDLALLHSR